MFKQNYAFSHFQLHVYFIQSRKTPIIIIACSKKITTASHSFFVSILSPINDQVSEM